MEADNFFALSWKRSPRIRQGRMVRPWRSAKEITVTAVDTGIVRDIPLDKLKASPQNARRTDPEAEIAELASSIDTHGLLQMPVVAPELDGEGNETGYYLVTAGERRRKALRLLAKRKRLKKTALIPCRLKADGSATELSLVENAMRRDMHPADQFEAFAKLHHEEGRGLEEIAGRFGVTAAVVKQRLKLAAVSPALVAGYRKGELTLDQLMAFAVTDDHQRQEEVWAQLSFNKSPEMIRRYLTTGQVNSRDRRVAFVGLAVYEAAGGSVLRDLFAEDHGGWLSDSALLDRLVWEKLKGVAEAVQGEGWKWVEIHPEYPHSQVNAFRRVYPKQVALPADEQEELDRLLARAEELMALAEDTDDLPPEIRTEIDAVEGRIGILERQACPYPADEMPRAGAIVSLTSDGALRIERGFVKREDEPCQPDAADGVVEQNGPQVPKEPKGPRPLPDALIADLTAHRTAALRECLAARPDVALLALTHALALQVFNSRQFDPGTCLGLKIELANLGNVAPGLDESRAGQALSGRYGTWASLLPDASLLWDWLIGQTEATRLALLAHCVACSVDAVRRPNAGKRALSHANQLAEALALDMAKWWQPTGASYLTRVSKERILEAVREGVSEKDAGDIAGLKKDAMVDHAERLLAGTDWLPAVLRAPEALLPANVVEAKAAE